MDLLEYLKIGWHTAIPVLLSTALISVLTGLPYRLFAHKSDPDISVFIPVFALLGSVTGLIMGNTRESSVSAILPALLTIITALVGYAFTKDSVAKLRPIAPYCLIAVMLSSYYCVNIGARIRQNSDKYREDYELWKLHYEKVDLEIEKALLLKQDGIEQDGKKQGS